MEGYRTAIRRNFVCAHRYACEALDYLRDMRELLTYDAKLNKLTRIEALLVDVTEAVGKEDLTRVNEARRKLEEAKAMAEGLGLKHLGMSLWLAFGQLGFVLEKTGMKEAKNGRTTHRNRF